MRRYGKIWLLLCALVLALAAAAPSLRAQDKQDKQDRVTLNFVDADIESVVRAVGQITGRNFLIDPRVKGTITIISSQPVAKQLVYQILLSALRLQGFAAVEGPGATRIVPEAQAKHFASPTTEKPSAGGGDRIVTRVYTLRFAQAAQLVQVLRPLVNANNVVVAYPNSNTLVITDYAENVERLDKIIDSIDRARDGDMHVIPVRHASALDLQQLLTRVMPEIGQVVPGGTPRLVVTVDTRTNSLVVRAEQRTDAERIRGLIAEMDRPIPSGNDIRVVYLRNAEAAKVAETLRALLTGDTGRSLGAGGGPGGSAATPFAPQQPSSTPGQPGAATQSPGMAPLGTGSAPAAAPVNSIIQAHPATNSLVIIAPDHIYNPLRAVIEKLDARRAQVYVEALIVEVSSKKAAEFGIQWQDLTGINQPGTNVIGGTNFSTTPGSNVIGIQKDFTTAPPGLNVGVIKGKITLPGVGEVLNLTMLARALESDTNANILSTPNLLTLDNEEARIIVGQNVPFITGSYAQATGTGAAVNPFQTIERKDVGLTLKVKPTVAEGGSVKLQVFQEVSTVSDTTNPAGVITNKRAIESTVLVDDGQIVVLGGLIQDDVQRGQDKVPVLGDIPVLGQLFRYEQRSRVKTNLMVFLRPLVLRDTDAAGGLTGDRYQYIRNQQEAGRLETRPFLPDLPVPVLPQLPATVPQPKPNPAPMRAEPPAEPR